MTRRARPSGESIFFAFRYWRLENRVHGGLRTTRSGKRSSRRVQARLCRSRVARSLQVRISIDTEASNFRARALGATRGIEKSSAT